MTTSSSIKHLQVAYQPQNSMTPTPSPPFSHNNALQIQSETPKQQHRRQQKNTPYVKYTQNHPLPQNKKGSKPVKKVSSIMPFHSITLLKNCSTTVSPQNRSRTNQLNTDSGKKLNEKSKYERMNERLAQTLQAVGGKEEQISTNPPLSVDPNLYHTLSEDYSEADARELTKELFREVNRKVKAGNQRVKKRKQIENCHFRGIQCKLSRQLHSTTNVQNAITLQGMIERCRAARHTRTNKPSTPSDQVLRLKSPTRTGMSLKLNLGADKNKPFSARSRAYSPRGVEHMKQQFNKKTKPKSERPKDCRNSPSAAKRNRWQEPTLSQFSREKERVSSARKSRRSAGRLEIEKSRIRIEGLIQQCQEYRGRFTPVNEGMNTFGEFYNIMDTHMVNLGAKLMQVRNKAIEDDRIF